MAARRTSNTPGASGASRAPSKVFNRCSFTGVSAWRALEGYDGSAGARLSNIASTGGVTIAVSSDIATMMA